jgi:hypothetical protein
MSDARPPAPLLPPAPSAAPPAPPFVAMRPPGFGPMPPPGFGPIPAQPFGGPVPYGYQPLVATPSKPPRPAVRVGSVLLVIGGLGLVAGSLLDWVTIGGERFNGFSDDVLTLDDGSNGGPAFVFFAVLLVGFGIAQFAARKVLAVAIIAVVVASFALLGVLAEVSDMSDAVRFGELFGAPASWGPGVPVLALAAMISLAGAITTLAKRRR